MASPLPRITVECRCGFLVSTRTPEAAQAALTDHVVYAHPAWDLRPIVEAVGDK